MTDQLTRRQLLERAAIGGAAITFPGILAACGGSGSKASGGTTSVGSMTVGTSECSNVLPANRTLSAAISASSSSMRC